MFKLVENKTLSCTNIKEVEFHAQPSPSKSIPKITKFLLASPSFESLLGHNMKTLLIPQESVNYYNSDSICKTGYENIAVEKLYVTKFLNTINCSGIPPHLLLLKIGIPVMLIKNVDQASGLCNGIRLRVTVLGKHFIKVVTLIRRNTP